MCYKLIEQVVGCLRNFWWNNMLMMSKINHRGVMVYLVDEKTNGAWWASTTNSAMSICVLTENNIRPRTQLIEECVD
jgi:hypothetical protein